MQWFANISNIDELRQKYKELLIKYHPDNNNTDTTKIMQSINSEYDNCIKTLKGVNNSNNTTTDFSEGDLKNVLNELIKLKSNITIELVGHWIWVYGPDTKAIKDKLKELGFRWSSKKQKWHWGTSTHKITKPMDMEFIRLKYGSTIYNSSKEEQKVIN